MATRTTAQQSQARFEKAKREAASRDQSEKSREGARAALEEKHRKDREESRQQAPVSDAAPADSPRFSDRLKFSEDGANVRQPSMTAPGYSSGYSAGYAAGLAAATAAAAAAYAPTPEGAPVVPTGGATTGRPAAAPSASKASAPAASHAERSGFGALKLKAVARTVLGAVRMERLVGFEQEHAWTMPRFAQQEESLAARQASFMQEEEQCSTLERDLHRHSAPSQWAADAAAVAMQRAARGRQGRAAVARKQDEKGVLRVDPGKGFAVAYSYANFEGGAWRGEGAFEAATYTAQYASPTRNFGERESLLSEGAFAAHARLSFPPDAPVSWLNAFSGGGGGGGGGAAAGVGGGDPFAPRTSTRRYV